jgi:hypothetical protein
MVQPYPAQPYPPYRPSWWNRNWKWFVPLGCLGCCMGAIGIVVAIAIFVLGALKTSDVYKEALRRVEESPRVVAEIGQPVEDGWFVSGSIDVRDSSGEANFVIPLKGPKGAGKVYVVASKRLGQWQFSSLTFEAESSSKRVDLLPQ